MRISRNALFLCWAIIGALLVANPLFAQIRVDSDRSLQAEVHVVVPELGKINLMADGRDFIGLYMKHSELLVSKGNPSLPQMTGMVMISADEKPKLEILETKFVEMDLDRPILPSRGAISRNIDPATVPFKMGATYRKNAWFPSTSQIVKISKPFIFREVRGVRLEAFPVQYNPVKNKLRVYSYIRAKINYDGHDGANINRGRTDLTRSYAAIYRKAFLNFSTMPTRLAPVDENGRLIIIAADELRDAALPFAEWKKKCGLKTDLIAVSEIGGPTQENIKKFLQEQFDEAGFSHVMLIGDAEQIPTNKGENEGADSDPVYVKLAGDDHVPDAIICRISANSKEKVAYQLSKIINYERFPSEGEGANWYGRTLGIASNEGSPTDFERMNEIKAALLGAKRFDKFDTVYAAKHSSGSSGGGYNGNPYPGGNDYPGSFPGGNFPGNPHYPPMPMYSLQRTGSLKSQVFESVNAGVSLINYIGHGSSNSWVTSGFNVQDCQKLANGLMLPVIVSVACVNGDFVGKNCFCEAWMNSGDIDNPRGAVAIFGSTTNQSWVPPCKVQTAIVSDFILNDVYMTVGGLMTNGIIKGLEIYGVEKHSEGVKMMEQWHLFGDGSTSIRTRKPFKPVYTIEHSSIEGESQIVLNVRDEAGKPVENARITCYTEKLELCATSVTTSEGATRLNIGLEKGDVAYLTIIGPDMIPVVDQKIEF